MKNKNLRTPYIEFDYTNNIEHSSRLKEAILYVVRIQKVFEKIVKLELSEDAAQYFEEPTLRETLEKLAVYGTKFDLSSQELPFLMRAELVFAYFQEKISKHLEQMDGIEIALPEGLREKIAEPIGKEVIEGIRGKARLAKKRGESEIEIDETIEIKIRSAIENGEGSKYYEMAFSIGGVDFSSLVSKPYVEARTQIQNALIPHTSTQLTEAHLGGKDAINTTLFYHALLNSRYSTPEDEAFYYDFLRRTFQVNGKLPETGEYNTIRIRAERYRSFPDGVKGFIHKHLLDNLMDAQKIKEASIIFSGEIDRNTGIQAMLDFGSSESGVRMERENDEEASFYFDNNPEEDLTRVAMGAQKLMEFFSSVTGTSLIKYVPQSASEKRRDRSNISFFSLMQEDIIREQFWKKEELEKFTASTFFEYFGIEDSNQKKELYNAYKRLFGETGYTAGTDEWSITINLKLEQDGRIIARYIYYGNESNKENSFEAFKYARSSKRGIDYFRKAEFEPNLIELKGILEQEIKNNNKFTTSLSAETNNQTPIRVEYPLFFQIITVPTTIDDLARWDERIVALIPFVEQNYEEYMESLGIGELQDEQQVKKAYRLTVQKEKAHPDATNDPAEKIQKASRLNELMSARDELIYKLQLEKAGNSSDVSVYLGNISQILKQE